MGLAAETNTILMSLILQQNVWSLDAALPEKNSLTVSAHGRRLKADVIDAMLRC